MTTPSRRTYKVGSESRDYSITGESRGRAIGSEMRGFKVTGGSGYPCTIDIVYDYFEDTFTRDDGAIANGWIGSFEVSDNKAIGTPTGTELISNGSFTDWSGGLPVGFTATNSSPPNREITNVDPSSGHGEGGSGAANLYTDSSTYIRLNKSVTMNANKFSKTSIDVTNVVAGSVITPIAIPSPSEATYKSITDSVAAVYIRTGGIADITFDNWSLLEMSMASQLALRSFRSTSNFGVRASFLTQPYLFGGVAIVDDPDNPQNGLFLVYQNKPAGSNSLLLFYKLLAGTLSLISSTNRNDLTNVEREVSIIKIGTNYTIRIAHLDVSTTEITDEAINNCSYAGMITSDADVLFSSFCNYDIPGVTSDYPLQNDWITAGDALTTMEEHPSATNPVLAKEDIVGWDDTPIFVADPFIVKKNDTYYMFFEIAASAKTELGYATSIDGLSWTYQGIFLSSTRTGSVANSYPYIFTAGGKWWMIPGMATSRAELWYSPGFPTQWEYVKTLVNASYMRDSTLFKWGANWYLMARNNLDTTVRLYWSSTMTGTYAEHPSSPIVTGVGEANTRNAGRPIIRDTSIDIFLQDNLGFYGNKVCLFSITTLSPTEFEWSELATSPILEGDGVGFNATGMHHMDRMNGGLSAVDGLNGSEFSIAIYRDTVE